MVRVSFIPLVNPQRVGKNNPSPLKSFRVLKHREIFPYLINSLCIVLDIKLIGEHIFIIDQMIGKFLKYCHYQLPQSDFCTDFPNYVI